MWDKSDKGIIRGQGLGADGIANNTVGSKIQYKDIDTKNGKQQNEEVKKERDVKIGEGFRNVYGQGLIPH